MTPERLQRAMSLFKEAIALPVPERTSFVAQSCAGDSELCQYVRALLAQDESDLGPVDDAGVGARLVAAQIAKDRTKRALSGPAYGPGVSVLDGQYTIVRAIGEGGMGTVYEAEQSIPRRTVALKALRPGITSSLMLQRLEHEAHVLGRLHHPGIAQIYDAGVADADRPDQAFFVMEYVRGKPLTEHCREQNLSIRDKLALMAKVCDAVQHAHQKGVVHRDLKPANILIVDEGARHGGQAAAPAAAGRLRHESTKGSNSGLSTQASGLSAQPKILDFGVARIVDADVNLTTMHTVSGQLVGTLSYMSPEQVGGDPNEVDTRTDVYALGVILYELLAGRRPHALANVPLAEAARIIRDVRPASLGSINPECRGDVETIVATAMDTDKQQRYQSASDLALDIRRYLDDQPILARPASALYHLRKFARRNRALVGVTAGGALMLALVVTISAIALGTAYRRQGRLLTEVEEQRDRATTARESERVARTRAEREADKARAIQEFLERMLASVAPTSANDPDVRMRDVLDQAAARLPGELEPEVEAAVRNIIGATYRGIGRHADAKTQLRKSVELRRRLFGDEHPQVAEGIHDLALAESDVGNYEAAAALHEEALRIRKALFGDDHADVAATLFSFGTLRMTMGDYPAAEEMLRASLDIRRRHLRTDDGSLASSLVGLGLLLHHKGRLDEAEALLVEALELRRSAAGELADRSYEVAESLNSLAGLRRDRGDYAQSETLLREVVQIHRNILGDVHPLLATTLYNLAVLLADRGDLDAADRLHREALDIRREVLDDAHPDMAESLAGLARVALAKGDVAEAVRLYRDALERSRRHFGEQHPVVAQVLVALANALRIKGDLADAESLARQALSIRRPLLGEAHPDVAECLLQIGVVLAARREYAAAEPLLRDALEINVAALGERHAIVAGNLNNLANVLDSLGDLAGAEAMYRRAVELGRELMGRDHPDLALGVGNLARVRMDRKDYVEADALYREALGIQERRLADDHPHLAITLTGLGLTRTRAGQPAEAEPLLRRALAIRREKAGPGSFQIGITTGALGECLTKLERFEEAEPLLLESHAVCTAGDGAHAYSIQQSLRRLAALYDAWGKPERAGEFREQVTQSGGGGGE